MKFIKIWNPSYPEKEFELQFVNKETDDIYITHYNKCDKSSDKVIGFGSCLKYRLATQEEIDTYIAELKQLKTCSDATLINDIRRFSINFSKEDLCLGGREIWDIADRYIKKEIESQGLGRKFLFMQGEELYIAISQDNNNVDYEFRHIHSDMISLFHSEPESDCIISTDLISLLISANIEKVKMSKTKGWIDYKESHTNLTYGIEIKDLVTKAIKYFKVDYTTPEEIFNQCQKILDEIKLKSQEL